MRSECFPAKQGETNLAGPVTETALRIGPIEVQRKSVATACAGILLALAEKRSLLVGFANTHLLYYAFRDAQFARRLEDFYLLNDGIGLSILARWATGLNFSENLNGTDFTPHLLRALPMRTRVMLIGAEKSVVLAAASWIKRRYRHLNVCGACDGFAEAELANGEALRHIQASDPQVMLVAMGNPLQENWIAECHARFPGRIFIGVGALFDYFSAAKSRAPMIVQRVKLEWLYRLCCEPRRLWARYIIEPVLVFGWLTLNRLKHTQAQPVESSG